MAEEQLREYFQQCILGRMSSVSLPVYQLFQEERKIWARQLMEKILSAKEL